MQKSIFFHDKRIVIPHFEEKVSVIWPCYTLIKGYTLIRVTRVLNTSLNRFFFKSQTKYCVFFPLQVSCETFAYFRFLEFVSYNVSPSAWNILWRHGVSHLSYLVMLSCFEITSKQFDHKSFQKNTSCLDGSYEW